jgi:hypothetical protein
MQNDHLAAYTALVTHSNPYDTISYSRYPEPLADAQRAYDAACERTRGQRDLLGEAYDLMSDICQNRQYDCIDFQRTVIIAQKRALAEAKRAEAQALAHRDAVRKEMW